MPSYTRPPGTEGVPWEDFREETGGNDSKEDFQLWLTNQKIQGRYSDITDFGSEYYQQARGLFGKIMPTQGANYVAGLQAGGGNFGASQVQAKASQRGFERRREDFLNTTVSQFALSSQAQAGGLLGQLSSNQQFMSQLQEQRRQFDEGGADIWDSLLNIGATALGTGAGFLIGGPPGAMIGGTIANQASSPKPSPSAQPSTNYGNGSYGRF